MILHLGGSGNLGSGDMEGVEGGRKKNRSMLFVPFVFAIFIDIKTMQVWGLPNHHQRHHFIHPKRVHSSV
jgi:hypothetical protein